MLADAALLNNQTLEAGGSSTATANGSFGISNATVAPVYTNATLSVSNNTQQASALGNTATNTLMLSPGVTPTVTVEERHHLAAAADRQHPVDCSRKWRGWRHRSRSRPPRTCRSVHRWR